MSPQHSVTAVELKLWLDHNEAIVIDVREAVEHNAEHIPNATHIALGELTKEKLPATNNKKIVVHCMLGKRGSIACAKLLNEDPSLDIYNLTGGISAWKEAGFEVAH